MQNFASVSVGLNLHARANMLMATEGRSRRFSCMSALTGPRLERSAAAYTLMMGMFEAACMCETPCFPYGSSVWLSDNMRFLSCREEPAQQLCCRSQQLQCIPHCCISR